MPKAKIETMTGARVVIETLIEQGVTDVFGYPGGQVLHIYDELYKASDRLRHILTAHEQGAAHAADGYSRVTGRVGAVIATSGPGATNLVTGLATAMLDSVPVVAVTGNVPTSLIGKDSFQEIDITGVTIPVTKHNFFVTNVDELADTIRDAFRIAKSGRPGPVLVDIPKDVQTALTSFMRQGPAKPYPNPIASEASLDAAAKLIAGCRRPYLYVGGGMAGAGLGKEVMKFASKIGAYVGCSFMGISAIPDDDKRFLGMQGMHGKYESTAANKAADLIIGVGVRFSDRATGNTSRYAKDAKIIHLEVDVSEIGKNIKPTVGIHGDLADSLARLSAKCEKVSHPAWDRQVAALKKTGEALREQAREADKSPLSPEKILSVINRYKTDDTVIATDVGQHQMWTAQFAHFAKPRRFVSSGGLGTMGFGMGAAIGASLAAKERAVLVTGDGSFGMNLNELATAVTYGIPLVIVLMNNGVLGLVRQTQMLFYEKRCSQTVLNRKTDYVKLADAFGAWGVRVETAAAFEKAFQKAMNTDGPTLIDAVIDKDELVLPMMPPDGSLDDIITTVKKEEN